MNKEVARVILIHHDSDCYKDSRNILEVKVSLEKTVGVLQLRLVTN